MNTWRDVNNYIQEEWIPSFAQMEECEVARLLCVLCARKNSVMKDKRYLPDNRKRKLHFIDKFVERCAKRNFEIAQRNEQVLFRNRFFARNKLTTS